MRHFYKALGVTLSIAMIAGTSSVVMADPTSYPVTYEQTLDGNDYEFEIAQAPEKAVSMSQLQQR